MAIIKRITDELRVKGKKKLDYYMLRGILPVVRTWPKRRKTPFWPRELEAQGVFGILSKFTTSIQDKVREAWIVESIGKRPRWQDTFIGLGMKYWGINGEIPPILIDYQIKWHTPNPELELLLQKIEAKYGKTEAQEIQTTGIVNIEDIETYRENLYFSLYNTKGIRLIAPFLEFIMGKGIDFTIKLQKLAGFIVEPLQVCFTDANVRIPKEKTYYYHGVKYHCVIEFDPDPFVCLPIEKEEEEPYHEWELIGADKSGSLRYTWAITYYEARNAVEANEPSIYTAGNAVGQYDSFNPENPYHNYFIYRLAIQFRTNQAYLPPGAPIQYAAIRVKRYATEYPLKIDFNVVVRDGQPEFPHDPIVVSDYYRKWYLGNYGQILASELPIDEFGDIVLNDRGLDRINLGGVYKVLLVSSRDMEDIQPYKSENEERIMIFLNNGNDYDPRLIIRITLHIPEVMTGPARYITKNRVMLEATMKDSGYWYDRYGFHLKEGLEGIILDFIVGGEGYYLATYYQWVINLKSGTDYYFRGFMQNGKGEGTGNWVKFTTLEE